MTDPLRTALRDVRSNWPSHYGPAEAKAWIAACDRVDALAADPARPTAHEDCFDQCPCWNRGYEHGFDKGVDDTEDRP